MEHFPLVSTLTILFLLPPLIASQSRCQLTSIDTCVDDVVYLHCQFQEELQALEESIRDANGTTVTAGREPLFSDAGRESCEAFVRKGFCVSQPTEMAAYCCTTFLRHCSNDTLIELPQNDEALFDDEEVTLFNVDDAQISNTTVRSLLPPRMPTATSRDATSTTTTTMTIASTTTTITTASTTTTITTASTTTTVTTASTTTLTTTATTLPTTTTTASPTTTFTTVSFASLPLATPGERPKREDLCQFITGAVETVSSASETLRYFSGLLHDLVPTHQLAAEFDPSIDESNGSRVRTAVGKRVSLANQPPSALNANSILRRSINNIVDELTESRNRLIANVAKPRRQVQSGDIVLFDPPAEWNVDPVIFDPNVPIEKDGSVLRRTAKQRRMQRHSRPRGLQEVEVSHRNAGVDDNGDEGKDGGTDMEAGASESTTSSSSGNNGGGGGSRIEGPSEASEGDTPAVTSPSEESPIGILSFLGPGSAVLISSLVPSLHLTELNYTSIEDTSVLVYGREIAETLSACDGCLFPLLDVALDGAVQVPVSPDSTPSQKRRIVRNNEKALIQMTAEEFSKRIVTAMQQFVVEMESEHNQWLTRREGTVDLTMDQFIQHSVNAVKRVVKRDRLGGLMPHMLSVLQIMSANMQEPTKLELLRAGGTKLYTEVFGCDVEASEARRNTHTHQSSSPPAAARRLMIRSQEVAPVKEEKVLSIDSLTPPLRSLHCANEKDESTVEQDSALTTVGDSPHRRRHLQEQGQTSAGETDSTRHIPSSYFAVEFDPSSPKDLNFISDLITLSTTTDPTIQSPSSRERLEDGEHADERFSPSSSASIAETATSTTTSSIQGARTEDLEGETESAWTVLQGQPCLDRPKELLLSLQRIYSALNCNDLITAIGCHPENFLLPFEEVVASCKGTWSLRCLEQDEGLSRHQSHHLDDRVVTLLTDSQCDLINRNAFIELPPPPLPEPSTPMLLPLPIDPNTTTTTTTTFPTFPTTTTRGSSGSMPSLLATCIALLLCSLWL